jgi:hypothetical protein
MKSCKESSGGWLSFANNPNRTTGGRSRTLAEATPLLASDDDLTECPAIPKTAPVWVAECLSKILGAKRRVVEDVPEHVLLR